MVVPVSPDAGVGGCPSGFTSGQWSCVYDGLSFKGTRLQFQDAGSYQNLRDFGGADWDTLSYSNTRGQQAELYEHTTNPHGNFYCMTGNTAGSNIEGNWSPDEFIFHKSTTGNCPSPVHS